MGTRLNEALEVKKMKAIGSEILNRRIEYPDVSFEIITLSALLRIDEDLFGGRPTISQT